MRMTSHYESYQNMIRERANTYANLSGLPASDFESIGDTVYMKAVLDFDSSRAAFSTHLHSRLTGAFRHHIRDERKMGIEPLERMNGSEPYETPRPAFHIRDMFETLSDEAEFVVRMILDGPEDFIRDMMGKPPRAMRSTIRNHLRKRGWAHSMIAGVFHELREAVSES